MHSGPVSNVPLFLIKHLIFKDQTFDNHVKRSMETRNAKLGFSKQRTHIPHALQEIMFLACCRVILQLTRGCKTSEASDEQLR
jgi:hypothetical protein